MYRDYDRYDGYRSGGDYSRSSRDYYPDYHQAYSPPPPPPTELTEDDSRFVRVIKSTPLVGFGHLQDKFSVFQHPVSETPYTGRIGRETRVGIWVSSEQIALAIRTTSSDIERMRDALGTTTRINPELTARPGIFDFGMIIRPGDEELGITASWEEHQDAKSRIVAAGSDVATPEFLVQFANGIKDITRYYDFSSNDYRARYEEPKTPRIQTIEEQILANQAKGTIYFDRPRSTPTEAAPGPRSNVVNHQLSRVQNLEARRAEHNRNNSKRKKR